MLIILKSYLLRMLKDKGTFISLIATPIILIMILGNALGGAFTLDFDLSLALVNDSNTQQHIERIEQIYQDLKVETKVTDEENANNLLEQRDVDAKVIFKEQGIEIVYGTSSVAKQSLTSQVIEAYIKDYSLQVVTNGNMTNTKINENLEVTSIKWGDVSPSAMDYYSVTMLAMIIVYSLTISSSLMSYELKDYRGLRLRSLPIKQWKVFLAISLSTTLMMVIQGLFVVVFTKYVYGAQWANNYFVIAGIIGLFAFIGSNIGMIIGGLVQVPEKASVAANIVIPIMTSLAGGYFKLPTGVKWLEYVQQLIPNYHIQEMLFSVNYTHSVEAINNGLIYGVIMVIITCSLLIYTVRRIAR